jgi:phage/plasmid-like protein (TIGR03299 family)
MAHELTFDREGRAAFCYNHRNGNPWHRLGTAFDGPIPAWEALIAARADRVASKVPLLALTEMGTVEVDSHCAVVWPSIDDFDVAQVLGVVSKDYHLVQYHEVVELAYAIIGAADDTPLLDTLGLLFDGRRLFGFIDFGDVAEVLPNGAVDRFTRGLGFMSSHDGSQSVTFATSWLRWVCNNTVTAGLGSARRVLRVRHTSNADERLAQAPQLLGLAYGGDEEFSAIVAELGAAELGPGELDRLIARIWPKPEGPDATDRAKAIWANRTERLVALYEGPSCAGGFGDNRWSVYNAVSEYLDHVQGDDGERRARGAIDPSSYATVRKERTLAVLLDA